RQRTDSCQGFVASTPVSIRSRRHPARAPRERLSDAPLLGPSRNASEVLQTSARKPGGVMLRVTTLYASSAAATARYYTHYLADAPGEAPGVWTGAHAANVGLSGNVDADQLEALLEGRDPIAGTPLGNLLVDRTLANGKVVRAVAGFDATFSAPKS